MGRFDQSVTGDDLTPYIELAKRQRVAHPGSGRRAWLGSLGAAHR